jgi:hypothetical protein
MATVTYQVHSFHETTTPKSVILNGRQVTAMVPTFVVELVNEEHGHTLRISPSVDEETSLRDLFQPGSMVGATFSKGA